MENIVANRGCPGILHLNTCERAISLLIIELSALVLALNVGEYKWLMIEVLSGSIPMKPVKYAITEYYLELPKSIEALQRQLIGSQSPQSSNNASAT